MAAANPFNLVRAFREFGVRGTMFKLWQWRTIKFGRLVGVDELGNKYYENNEDYPLGQNRWVEYAGEIPKDGCDPSTIPAEWHIWLHQITDDPPTKTTTGSTKDLEYIATVEKSDAIYQRNLGGVVAPASRNESSTRPRAYGVGNGSWSKPNEEKFYTQPGHPLDPRNKHARPARAAWTLADTAESLRARQGFNFAPSDGAAAAATPTFGLPTDLAYTEEEAAFVADTQGTWSLIDARSRVRELKKTLRTLAESAEYNPRQTEEPIALATEALKAAEERVAVIEGIAAKWKAAGGVGSVDNGLP
ncbi:hypothetical protein FNF27_04144 [Cafeteria roenbergensis]|uniref:NADH dehydrogenase [ubiquinone] 1 alpha subcomplex subunit 12 n=1 Tax=Cafeteria roenbergensis TaxID=33653 RepID=A0A5A8E9C7_CAFRO|nr:hypothetical protein FNF27_04144 [Cafeteria roenbergensis]|mmetsp:Transcript_24096/g.90924  ORF Transcript_24096/g.90924 Transcript_24096/m.90924 type:complete len:304 (-) Transcript_24096:252-1163(-)